MFRNLFHRQHRRDHKAEPCGRASEIDREYLAAIGIEDRLEIWRAEVAKLVQPQTGD
jgi:hypothetical protein